LEIPIRVILVEPPPGVAFALQKGRGADFEVASAQLSRKGNLVFDCAVTLKDGSSPPDFTGPFTQGPKGDRFVYIGVGTFAGQKDSCWSRRIKIPLKGISKTQVRDVLSKARHALVVRIPGTGRDGTPSCATVKPVDDWTVVKS
jgi:hypothetical protein